MDRDLANRIVAFVNEHDDGTPQPRAHVDERLAAVVIQSTVIWPGGASAIELDSVRTQAQALAVLGY